MLYLRKQLANNVQHDKSVVTTINLSRILQEIENLKKFLLFSSQRTYSQRNQILAEANWSAIIFKVSRTAIPLSSINVRFVMSGQQKNAEHWLYTTANDTELNYVMTTKLRRYITCSNPELGHAVSLAVTQFQNQVTLCCVCVLFRQEVCDDLLTHKNWHKMKHILHFHSIRPISSPAVVQNCIATYYCTKKTQNIHNNLNIVYSKVVNRLQQKPRCKLLEYAIRTVRT